MRIQDTAAKVCFSYRCIGTRSCEITAQVHGTAGMRACGPVSSRWQAQSRPCCTEEQSYHGTAGDAVSSAGLG